VNSSLVLRSLASSSSTLLEPYSLIQNNNVSKVSDLEAVVGRGRLCFIS